MRSSSLVRLLGIRILGLSVCTNSLCVRARSGCAFELCELCLHVRLSTAGQLVSARAQ